MGGNKERLFSSPFDLPLRIAVINCSSFQLPIPVGSEVRLAAKDMPQGPAEEVKSGPNIAHPFLITLLSATATGRLEG